MFRQMLGFFACLMQSGMGFVIFLMKTPQTINCRFLGEFMIVMATIMFIVTMWIPASPSQTVKNV